MTDPINFRSSYQFQEPKPPLPPSSQYTTSAVLSSANSVPYNSGILHHSANNVNAIQNHKQNFENVKTLTQTFVINSYNRNITSESFLNSK